MAIQRVVLCLLLLGMLIVCLHFAWRRWIAAWADPCQVEATLSGSELRVDIAKQPIRCVRIVLNEAVERRFPELTKGLNVLSLDEFPCGADNRPIKADDVTLVRIEGIVGRKRVAISVPFKSGRPQCTETVLQIGRREER
jgi:hypothetical protein